MCEDINARIIIKQGSGVPTIPASTDHRNGDWIDTDIYEGEFYQDTVTGIVYTRDATGIIINSISKRGVWKAKIDQTGTTAPTLTVLIDTIGLTITPNYAGVGGYTLTGFSGILTGNIEVSLISNIPAGEYAISQVADVNTLLIETGDNATSTVNAVIKNAVLDTVGNTITVTQY
jgi:hypothetical protein